MKIINPKTLEHYWLKPEYAKAERRLKAWIKEISAEIWTTSADIKTHYRNASIINKNRVVFNICGNKYRLVVSVRYDSQKVLVRFFGTHAEYDQVDVSTV